MYTCSMSVPDIHLQIYCTVYTSGRDVKIGPFHAPRHWMTLDQQIIWDFPGSYFAWNHPEVQRPLQFIEEGYWTPGSSVIAQLFREYLDTPIERLLHRAFEQDYW